MANNEVTGIDPGQGGIKLAAEVRNSDATATSVGLVVRVAGAAAAPVGTSPTYDRTSTSANVAAQTVRAANTARKGLILTNAAYASVYIGMGSTPSATSFSFLLAPFQTLVLPVPVYTGIVSAEWEVAASGKMWATEET